MQTKVAHHYAGKIRAANPDFFDQILIQRNSFDILTIPSRKKTQILMNPNICKIFYELSVQVF